MKGFQIKLGLTLASLTKVYSMLNLEKLNATQLSVSKVSSLRIEYVPTNPWQMDANEAARLGVTFPWINPTVRPYDHWYDVSDTQLAMTPDHFSRFFYTECYNYQYYYGRIIQVCYSPTVMGFKYGTKFPISELKTCDVGVTCKLQANKLITQSPQYTAESILPSQHWYGVISKIQPHFASLQTLSPSSNVTKEIHGPGKFIMNFKPLLWYVRMQAYMVDLYTGQAEITHVNMQLPIMAGQARLNGVYTFEQYL